MDQMKTWKIFGVVVVGGCILEAIYYAFKFTMRKKENGIYETLFFPDTNATCKEHYSSRHGCTAKYCSFSHEETAFFKLMRHLGSARRSLDVCVFVFTSVQMRDTILELHKKGVRVRFITDKEQENVQGSAIGSFRSEGIRVHANSNSYLMHHKFVVVDGFLLINGSFNWTRQAITGNHENILITDDYRLVQPYKQEFERLWKEFDSSAML